MVKMILDDGRSALDQSKVDSGVWHPAPYISDGARVRLRYSDDTDGYSPYVERLKVLLEQYTKKMTTLQMARLDDRVRQERKAKLQKNLSTAWQLLFAQQVIVDHSGVYYYRSEADHRARQNRQEMPKDPTSWASLMEQNESVWHQLRNASFKRAMYEHATPEIDSDEVPDDDALTLEAVELALKNGSHAAEDELPKWLPDAIRSGLTGAGIGSAPAVLSAGQSGLVEVKGLGKATAKKLLAWAQEQPEDPLDPLAIT